MGEEILRQAAEHGQPEMPSSITKLSPFAAAAYVMHVICARPLLIASYAVTWLNRNRNAVRQLCLDASLKCTHSCLWLRGHSSPGAGSAAVCMSHPHGGQCCNSHWRGCCFAVWAGRQTWRHHLTIAQHLHPSIACLQLVLEPDFDTGFHSYVVKISFASVSDGLHLLF